LLLIVVFDGGQILEGFGGDGGEGRCSWGVSRHGGAGWGGADGVLFQVIDSASNIDDIEFAINIFPEGDVAAAG
jgi:hypothetical protein